MAVRHGYGKIEGTDALVFAYDTGDTVNSYKGEPTENIFLNPTFIGTPFTQTSTITDNWNFSGYTGDTGFKFHDKTSSPIPLKFPNEGAVVTIGASADGVNRRFYCNEVLEPGQTYSVSAWIYVTYSAGVGIAHFEYGGANLNTGYFSSTATHPNHVIGEWYYWEDTYTVGADYTDGLIGPVFGGSVDHLLAMQRFQIEKKDHATQFVNGTRSATEGLKDLTGNSTIDLTNLDGYNSNAEIDFDGTDDRIEISDNSSVDVTGAEITLEQVLKKDTNSAFSPIHKNQQYSLRITSANQIQYADSSDWSYSSFGPHNMGVSNGDYFHLVAVKKDGVVTIYVNNSVVVSKSFGGSITSTSNKLFIGSYSGTTNYINGQIPVTKIYNRALTAAEVKNNYRHYKNRFGI